MQESGPSRAYTFGRLQVYVGGKWGEICDTGFGENAADVACHQLGFEGALEMDDDAESGDGNK